MARHTSLPGSGERHDQYDFGDLPGAGPIEEARFPTLSEVVSQFDPAEETILKEIIRWWQARLETGTAAFATPISAYLMLPHLRGFWPFSAVDENGDALDLSGHGRTLANNNAAFALHNYTPYAALDGGNAYFSRAGEPGLSITGALSLGCWLYVDAGFSRTVVLGKMGGSGSYGYGLEVDSLLGDDYLKFNVSSTGSNLVVAQYQPPALAGAWHFVAGAFDPGEAITFYYDSATPVETGGAAYAAIHDNAEPFTLGHSNKDAANYLSGRIAFPFVCAAVLTPATVNTLFESTRALFGR